MSRQFDAKQSALQAYPNDRECGVELFLEILDTTEADVLYEEGMTAEKYIYGDKSSRPEAEQSER